LIRHFAVAAKIDNEKIRIAVKVLGVFASLLFIFCETLWPLNFIFHPLTWREYILVFDVLPSSLLDFPENVLLFFPLGLSLASILRSRSHLIKLASPLILTGICLSLAIESLQIFLPGRTPNLSDLMGNTIGTALGCGLWYLLNYKRAPFRVRPRSISAAHLSIVYSVFLVVVGIASGALAFGLQLRGLDLGYPMVLGGKDDPDESPWDGGVRDLLLLDRSVNSQELQRLASGAFPPTSHSSLVGYYPLDSLAGLNDSTKSLPSLLPMNNLPPLFNENGLVFTNGFWARTVKAITAFSERINSSHQFTVAFTVLTSDAMQTGPARILSISPGAFERNLTIGQSDTAISLRWRSLLSGKNGTSPELEFPGVFTSRETRRIALSFDGRVARLSTDKWKEPRELFLGPEIGLGAILHNQSEWPLRLGLLSAWTLVATSAILFIPFGTIAGVAAPLVQLTKIRFLLISLAITLIACFLLDFPARRLARWQFVLLSFFFTVFGYALPALWKKCSLMEGRLARV
jgi:glycopeptide antibiotics resistance protein